VARGADHLLCGAIQGTSTGAHATVGTVSLATGRFARCGRAGLAAWLESANVGTAARGTSEAVCGKVEREGHSTRRFALCGTLPANRSILSFC